MNLNKKIGFLLDNGFTPNFVSTLNESKINLLFEKINKKEVGEQTTQPVNASKTTKTTDIYTLNPGGTMDIKNAVVSNKDGKTTIEMMEEDELDEKFESKAQQGLFWARCNKCKTDDCKWCKMAKEFSKSTSKKQYKNMSEKKHPEKTVKYKKKETKESYLDMVQSGALGGYRENLGKVSPSLKFDAALKEHVENIIIKDLQPAMKKKDLMKLIEGELRKRKSLKENFYYDEIGEDFDMMSRYEEDEEEYDMSPGREEPGMPPGREDDDTPKPRNKMSRLSRRMNDPFVPTIEPGIKEPKIKPKEPDRAPEWEPDFDEPMEPNPDVDPEPQAKRRMKFRMNDPFAPTIEPGIKPSIKPSKPEREPEWSPEEDEPMIPSPDVDPEPQAHKRRTMNKFKDEFYEAMKRMDEAYHKPLKYLK